MVKSEKEILSKHKDVYDRANKYSKTLSMYEVSNLSI